MISDLLLNSDLWKLLLRYMRRGNLRDFYLHAALKAIKQDVAALNPTALPDKVFFTQIVDAIHTQLSHIRDLKRYKEKVLIQSWKVD